jgi:mono/diheme cytochrome c family protein
MKHRSDIDGLPAVAKRMLFVGLLPAVLAGAAWGQHAPAYNEDVAPILYQNCAGCHRPGEVAPFPLLTYQDAAKRASLLAAVTRKRYMPPWKPDPGPMPFANERRLSEEQIETIQKWAAGGAPEGDPAKRPGTPHFPEGWHTGSPDLVLIPPDVFQVPADGPDIYHCVVMPLRGDARYLRELEFQPGNRRVVHHALIYVDTTGTARRLDAATPEPGYPCVGGPGFPLRAMLGFWVPGPYPQPSPPGTAKVIPKEADVVVQIHYHPSGKIEEDRSSVGLTLTAKPARELQTIFVRSSRIAIAAGDAHYVVEASTTLPADVDLLDVTPHAHYICREMTAEAHLPDGTVIRLIHIPDWDFNWQGLYTYQQPLRLPRGTRVALRYLYDNSEGNPRNPSHPPQRVAGGERTIDEMALLIMTVALANPAETAHFQTAMRLTMLEQLLEGGEDLANYIHISEMPVGFRLMYWVFDGNHDGRLDANERSAFVKQVKWVIDLMSSPHWALIRMAAVVLLLAVLLGAVFFLGKGFRFVMRRFATARALPHH